MSLRPQDTVQKLLISTTSRLVGEFERSGLLLTHSSPEFHWTGQGARNALMCVFTTPPIEPKAGVIVPNYSATGDLVCAWLAVLFGKRFDNHGAVEMSGSYMLPDLRIFGQTWVSKLPQNSESVRVDGPISLDLAETARIEALFAGNGDKAATRTFNTAAKFYLQALQNVEHDAEVAYLHLITAGEILSNFHEYDPATLVDDDTAALLDEIRSCHPNGQDLARSVSGRLLQVKRRFVRTILDLVDADFFQRTETLGGLPGLAGDKFSETIRAAYDLRSRYVHTGVPFGSWVGNFGGNEERHFGRPVLEDKELGKIIYKAPTYVGLERVIRYCLLRFAGANALMLNAA